MCYDVTSGLKNLIKYAKHRHDDPAYIAALEKKLEHLLKGIKGHHYVNGFSHPKLLVFTNTEPLEPKAFYWGLIPHWAKDADTARQLSNQTLNAKGETIFEKPSFRESAKNRRCLIYIDAFYEHHHLGSKTYPFHIDMKDGSPLALAGLWDEWVNKETGEILHTASIVTCRAGGLMAKIHNNPKADEPRMPAILPREKQDEWLQPFHSKEDKDHLLKLLQPFDESLLEYHTVRKLKGKNAVGDTPEAEEEFNYPELEMFF